MINWKVRFKNKNFWIAFIPAVLLLIKQICALFGIELNFATTQDGLIALLSTIFSILVLLGIVNDPTTAGISDSMQAMTYNVPRED